MFFIGLLIGITVMVFMKSTGKNNREHEIYEEGFMAGKEFAENHMRYGDIHEV